MSVSMKNCLKLFTPFCRSRFQSKVPRFSRYMSTGSKERQENMKQSPVTWLTVSVSVFGCGSLAGFMYYLKRKKEAQREADRKRQLGKALIGGPWELVNHDGKLQSTKDYLGKWALIYFGFTHCPDICPDEIEKMCNIINKIETRKLGIDIVPLFFTVDPERDTPERVKKYVQEFSPKLMGFTGTKEQVEKVCKAFRVYHSEGPRDEFADYIVDHTIIIYLVDPNGNFVDYYGQRRSEDEIISAVHLLDMKYKRDKKLESPDTPIWERVKLNLT